MNFIPPVPALMQALRVAGNVGSNASLAEADAEAIVAEAGRFAADVLSPLYRVGDAHGVKLSNGKVTTAPV
jgi:acyl-CoA dehydrogenase